MFRMAILASAAAVALVPAAASAQAAAATATSQKVDARAVVADVRRILNENYVLPEMRPKLDAAAPPDVPRPDYAATIQAWEAVAAAASDEAGKTAVAEHVAALRRSR